MKVKIKGMVVSWSCLGDNLRMAVEAPDAVRATETILGDRIANHRIAIDSRTGIVRLTFTPSTTILLYGIEVLTKATLPEVANRVVYADCSLVEYKLPSGQLGWWVVVKTLSIHD